MSFTMATKKYRQMELLVKYMNRAYSTIVLPTTEYVLVAIIFLGIVGAFRIDGPSRYALIIIALVCYIALVITFRAAAELGRRSRRLLCNWKRLLPKNRNRIEHRIHGTLREFRITIGSFGYVDTTLILTLSGIILDNTINFLLITGS